MTEIARLAKLKDAEFNEAKKILAFEATKIAHGEDAEATAAGMAASLFGGVSDAGGNIDASGAPVVKVAAKFPMPVVEFAMLSGLFPTKSEARRLIEQGGFAIDNVRVGIDAVVKGASEFLVQKGKKVFVKVVVRDS